MGLSVRGTIHCYPDRYLLPIWYVLQSPCLQRRLSIAELMASAVPETYAPTLLRKRAELLSTATGRYYRASVDAKEPLNPKVLMKTSLGRPWILLFREPIVLAISVYMSIIYGTLYMVSRIFANSKKVSDD